MKDRDWHVTAILNDKPPSVLTGYSTYIYIYSSVTMIELLFPTRWELNFYSLNQNPSPFNIFGFLNLLTLHEHVSHGDFCQGLYGILHGHFFFFFLVINIAWPLIVRRKREKNLQISSLKTKKQMY